MNEGLPDLDVNVSLGTTDMTGQTGTIVPAIAGAVIADPLIPAGVLVFVIRAAG